MFRGPSSAPAAIEKIGMFCRAAASTARSGSSPVLERPSVARITPATGWPRCAASTPCRASPRGETGRFGLISSSLRDRADSPAPGLGRRLQVVENSSRPRAERLEVRAEHRLDQVQPAASRAAGPPATFPPSDSSFRLAAISTARELSVYGSENLMLSESSTMIGQLRRDRLAARRDQHRLEQHDRDGQQREHAQADEQPPASSATGRGPPSR